MRLLVLAALLVSLGSSEIERAQQMSRAGDAERARFHHQYLIDLPDPTVTRIEVVTEFRRLVLISEDHLLHGDWLFTQSAHAAEEALAPWRDVITLKASVRFNPLNVYVTAPAYLLAVGRPPAGPLEPLETQMTVEYSAPFKGRNGRTISALAGEALNAGVSAARIGQATWAVGVMLDGKEVARTPVDFARLD